ncbi:hypothetical protein [Streptomyces sp. NBC_00582]|uniref:hypothetical protein n=1 Tax=Streptomyces sp. NBC_00582 TaxID=2975783 RepID=UPI002E80B3EA|nr:hypothetical protein [Streptomyces sp. NBC_00582]WUB64627.1 hypothetical protein OG852_31610 [Streptomyces sp. NBC_00582]
MTRTSPARRRTARAVRGTGDAVRAAAPLGPLAAVLLSIDTADGPHLDMPLLHLVVVMLAGLGVDRLGLLLHDLGRHIERPRPAAS